MVLSIGGMIGAVVGVVWAFAFYALAMHGVRRGMRTGEPMDDTKLQKVRMIFLSGFVVFPIAFYLFGQKFEDLGLLPK